MKYLEMKVSAVLIDPDQASPLVILKDAEEKNVLPLCIGASEAASILLSESETDTNGPSIWDLLGNLVAALGGRLKKISINSVNDGNYNTEISLVSESGAFDIPARPGDAIAIALKNGIPILVNEDVIKDSRVMNFTPEKIGSLSSEELNNILESFSAEDFGKYKM